MRARPGLALILVVGVLGILAVLGSAVAVLSQLERRASVQRVHATRAWLLARSGLEDALARICMGQDPGSGNNRYGGEDWDLSGTLEPYEEAESVYQPGKLNTFDCPLRHAMRPSFAVMKSLDAATVPVGGRLRGYSGALGSEGSSWALEVEDESGKINVNGGLLDGGDRDGDGTPDHRDAIVSPSGAYTDLSPSGIPCAADLRGWNHELTRILDVLGFEVGVPALGSTILRQRPEGGYRGREALLKALEPTTTTDLSPYLTTTSWVDRKVIRPTGFDWNLDNNTTVNRRPMPRLEEGGRPPVNLNSAPRPVLVALLEGLLGVNSDGTNSNCSEVRDLATPNPWSTMPVFMPSAPVSTVRAGRIADAMMAARPWRSRNQFAAFCDGLVTSGVINWQTASSSPMGGGLTVADLLKANFDPNSMIDRYTPDQLMARRADKSNLYLHSTEGALEGSGLIRLCSEGRVVDARSRLLAERTLFSTVEAWRILRHSTQEDFVGGRSLAADSPGEPRYLSLSTDPLNVSAGASAQAGWWGGPPPGAGVSVLTYPEPPTALPGQAAQYDGYVGLATLEHKPGSGIRFLHHFDDALDAEPESAGPRPGVPPTFSLDLGSGWNEPGSFYTAGAFRPDGLRATLTFNPVGNFPATSGTGDRAVISFWWKSPAPWGSAASWQEHVSVTRASGSNSQTMMIGAMGGWGAPFNVWGMVVENRLELLGEADDSFTKHLAPTSFNSFNFSTYDVPRERHYYDKAVVRSLGHRWHLVTAYYDTEQAALSAQAWYSVEGVDNGTGDSSKGWTPDNGNWYGLGAYTVALNPSQSQKLIVPGATFRVGNTRWVGRFVLDELAIYDLGSGAQVGAQGLAATRLKEGRYYKMDDARYYSPTVALDGGARLLSASWTAYLPRENRLELNSTLGFISRNQDARLQKSDLVIDLMRWDPGTSSWVPVKRLESGERVGMHLLQFKYRATFRPAPTDPATGLPDPLNQPVLETPFLDDITFRIQGANGPRFLAWGSP